MSSSESTPLSFVLHCFESSMNSVVDASVNTSIPETYSPNSLNPSIVYEVDTRVLRDVFQIGSDATDMTDVNVDDLRYYVDMTRWPLNYKVNIANGMADYVGRSDSESVSPLSVVGLTNSIYITDSRTSPPEAYNREKCLMKDVVVRDLANQIFGTPNAVDLFNNEEALVQDIENQGKSLWLNNILYRLRYVDTSSNTSVMQSDQQGVKCLKNNSESLAVYDASLTVASGVTVTPGESVYAPLATDSIANPSKTLLTQMLRTLGGRKRFETNSAAAPNASPFSLENTLDGASQRQPLPFMEGDTIAFKVLQRPGQNLISTKTLVDRFYYVTLVARNNTIYKNTPNTHLSPSESSQTVVLI